MLPESPQTFTRPVPLLFPRLDWCCREREAGHLVVQTDCNPLTYTVNKQRQLVIT
ncbi:uncharacterized protein EI90DRAFT_3076750 [Cantharellus anzutake]|uniref:uncharacterized protein n=1 Tax=Cantharellus anzutake TaxID=1750568 RepID=UPI001907CC92|nr:uncharacterized protein EI90DRAFT_3076750 [Cantharellus anzutake]KAF8323472.1 hypothetical protein EI90DRAFT_3076750 [Cantharellus anzutake]